MASKEKGEHNATMASIQNLRQAEADAQNTMPLVTIELTLYCRIIPHQVPGTSVETRAVGSKGGFAVGGFSQA